MEIREEHKIKEEKMKKKNLVLSILLLFTAFAFADAYTYPEIEDKFVGTYIPADVDNQLMRTKLFYEALDLGYPIHHDVLFMGKNKCYSDAGFHDGYAITIKDFNNFRFVENDYGYYCIDDKGNSYRKISDKLDDQGYGYEYYTNYILNVIFDFAKNFKNLEIKGDKVIIDNVEYSVNLDGNFYETKNVVLWLYSERKVYALVKNGVTGELHNLKRDEEEFFWRVDEKVIKEFPLMFVKADDEFPDYWNLPKKQIRHLRNLIYARHGYAFKSQDLKEIFENFKWYRVNPKFKVEDLNRDEKDYIERLLGREKDIK